MSFPSPMNMHHLCIFVLLFPFSLLPFSAGGVQLVIANGCKESIWPGILGTAGHATPLAGGFHLRPGAQRFLSLPGNWSGRIWGRTGCRFLVNGAEKAGSCLTGDCSGRRRCAGAGGSPPATVVEMTLGTPESPLHYYDVSLVNGFNLPVSVVPLDGGGSCGAAACEADVNEICPAALAVTGKDGKVVGCSTPCLATGLSRYCCTGEYAEPDKCRPSVYGRVLKVVCPRAYTYPSDEATGLITCRAPRYLLTFCPPN